MICSTLASTKHQRKRSFKAANLVAAFTSMQPKTHCTILVHPHETARLVVECSIEIKLVKKSLDKDSSFSGVTVVIVIKDAENETGRYLI